jgi:hypothetical protein
MTINKSKLKAVDPAILKKRGRPRGTKNKIKVVTLSDKDNRNDSISDFQKTLEKWDCMENQVNWEEITKKQENVINIYKVENEELAKICKQRWAEIEHLKYLITYLERKLEDASV